MLEKPYDATDWMKKSVESLSTAQKHFESDIRSLDTEIYSIEKESRMYQKQINDSFIDATFDFFFGNSSLEEKKRRLPEYRQLIGQYRSASIKTEDYRVEMTKLLEQIEQEVTEVEQQKLEAKQKLVDVKNNIIDIAQNEKIFGFAKKLPKLKGLNKEK